MLVPNRQPMLALLVLALLAPQVLAQTQSAAASYLQVSGLASEFEEKLTSSVQESDRDCRSIDSLSPALRQKIDGPIQPEHLGAAYETVVRKHFSEEELMNLVAFYSSPLGRRLVEVAPSVEKQGSDAVILAASFWRRDLIKHLNESFTDNDLKLLDLPEKPGDPALALAKYSPTLQTTGTALLESSGWSDYFQKLIGHRRLAYQDLLESQKRLSPKTQRELSRLIEWGGLQPYLLEILLGSFSEPDIRGLAEFFSTESGSKALWEKSAINEALGELLVVAIGERAGLRRNAGVQCG